jgi:diguanylate cyclase (GGDEF)-like protein
MSASPARADVFSIVFRNYWWTSTLGGLYFVLGFVAWGGTRESMLSSGLFVVAGGVGLAVHYALHRPHRTARRALIIGHLLLGHAVLVWQQAHLPISDYTTSGNPAIRDFLIYLVSSLFVGSMSMLGGTWGAVLGLSAHYAFIFAPAEEFSFKAVFPALIALAGLIVSTAFWKLEEAYGRLERLANHDYLTGLFNRHRLTAEYERLQRTARSAGVTLLLIAWDLDHLKRINDTQGHAAGDACIRDFARALRASVRKASFARSGDAAFRVGGDEFISLHLDAASGETVLSRVRQAFPAVSAGWVRAESLSLDQALTTADAALYADKDRRRRGRMPRPVASGAAWA